MVLANTTSYMSMKHALSNKVSLEKFKQQDHCLHKGSSAIGTAPVHLGARQARQLEILLTSFSWSKLLIAWGRTCLLRMFCELKQQPWAASDFLCECVILVRVTPASKNSAKINYNTSKYFFEPPSAAWVPTQDLAEWVRVIVFEVANQRQKRARTTRFIVGSKFWYLLKL